MLLGSSLRVGRPTVSTTAGSSASGRNRPFAHPARGPAEAGASNPDFRRIVVSALAAAAALLVTAGVRRDAFAHGNSVLDLEAIESHVAGQAATATGRAGRAYRALAKVLGREIRRPLIDEIAKLVAVARACDGPCRADSELAAEFDVATLAAEQRIRLGDDDIAAVLRSIERPADRDRVTKLSGIAAATAARAVTLPQRVLRLRQDRAAAITFDRAARLGRRLVLRAIRHGAPGQPIAKGPAGTIDTYAGSGAPGFGGEAVPARAAAFYQPQDVAIDPRSGLVHIADLNNHRIRRIDADGKIRTVAGSGRLGDSAGPAREAELHHPTGIAFHPVTGELYIAGWHASRILRLDGATGEIVYAAGDGELGFSGDGDDAAGSVMNYPVNLAFASDGTWYVGDQGNERVRRVDGATNVIETVAGSGADGFAGDDSPALGAAFHLPSGDLAEPAGRVCLSPDERWLYVADTGNRRVRRIDLAAQDRTITTFAGNGDAASAGDDGPAAAASMLAPVDVECDSAGNLYVCDRDAAVVRRVDAVTQRITTVAGNGTAGFHGDGGPAAAAKLDLPSGICVDRIRGRIYVADAGNQVIRVVWE